MRVENKGPSGAALRSSGAALGSFECGTSRLFILPMCVREHFKSVLIFLGIPQHGSFRCA